LRSIRIISLEEIATQVLAFQDFAVKILKLNSLAQVVAATFFGRASLKIFKTLNLRAPACEQSSQNIEALGLTVKILISKSLVAGANTGALGFPAVP
jgi:hypothetical protein